MISGLHLSPEEVHDLGTKLVEVVQVACAEDEGRIFLPTEIRPSPRFTIWTWKVNADGHRIDRVGVLFDLEMPWPSVYMLVESDGTGILPARLKGSLRDFARRLHNGVKMARGYYETPVPPSARWESAAPSDPTYHPNPDIAERRGKILDSWRRGTKVFSMDYPRKTITNDRQAIRRNMVEALWKNGTTDEREILQLLDLPRVRVREIENDIKALRSERKIL